MDTATSKYQLTTSGNQFKWHQYDYKVTSQNEFYRKLLNTHTVTPYEPEEGEIVEIYKIPCTPEKITGLECNQTGMTTSAASTANLRQCESQRSFLHQTRKNLRNSQNSAKIDSTKMPNETKWNINHRPVSKVELLCEKCGISCRYTQALLRHMHIQHGDKTLICPDCDYQTPRKDNLRRHLRTVHKYIQVAEKLNSVDVIHKSTKPTKAKEAPLK